MLTKKYFPLLLLSGLLALPAGIATADEIKVQTDNVKVTVGEDSGVRVNSTPRRTMIVPQRIPTSKRIIILPQRIPNSKRIIILPQRTPTSIAPIPQNSVRSFRILKSPGTTSTLQCRGRNYTHTSTQSNSSGTATNSTYSSTTTTSCQ